MKRHAIRPDIIPGTKDRVSIFCSIKIDSTPTKSQVVKNIDCRIIKRSKTLLNGIAQGNTKRAIRGKIAIINIFKADRNKLKFLEKSIPNRLSKYKQKKRRKKAIVSYEAMK